MTTSPMRNELIILRVWYYHVFSVYQHVINIPKYATNML